MEIKEILLILFKIFHGFFITISVLLIMNWMFLSSQYFPDLCSSVSNYLQPSSWLVFAIGISIIACWIHVVYSKFASWKAITATALFFGFLLIALVFLRANLVTTMGKQIDPRSAIINGLGAVPSEGYGIPQVYPSVCFIQGQQLIRNEFTTGLSIEPDQIGIYCVGKLCSDQGAVSIFENKRIDVNRNTAATITTCGNSKRTQLPNYCIVLGDVKDTKSVTDECNLRCGLK